MAARTRVYHMTIGENDRLVRATNPPHALIETPLGVHRLGGVPYMLTSEPGLTPEQRTGLISGGPNADLRRALGPNAQVTGAVRRPVDLAVMGPVPKREDR